MTEQGALSKAERRILRRTIHEALAREHFGDSPVHPAYMEPDSDMGHVARRITKSVRVEVDRMLAERSTSSGTEGSHEQVRTRASLTGKWRDHSNHDVTTYGRDSTPCFCWASANHPVGQEQRTPSSKIHSEGGADRA